MAGDLVLLHVPTTHHEHTLFQLSFTMPPLLEAFGARVYENEGFRKGPVRTANISISNTWLEDKGVQIVKKEAKDIT